MPPHHCASSTGPHGVPGAKHAVVELRQHDRLAIRRRCCIYNHMFGYTV